MNFDHSPKVQALQARLSAFMQAQVFPREAAVVQELQSNRAAGNPWLPLKTIEALKPMARDAGLWNLFLPQSERGAGLTNLEYAPLAELMGMVPWSSEVFNCSAPDTGNMETHATCFGTPDEQKADVAGATAGAARSGPRSLMTEPDGRVVSDATNVRDHGLPTRRRLTTSSPGSKWWISGAADTALPRSSS